ncbi:MAG: hypothetical protein LC104_14865 [Bacteroidales bacterium]|nr:hypothetical protein [Bacteroidales bacterium]
MLYTLLAVLPIAYSGCGLMPQEVTISTKPANSPRNERAFWKKVGYENTAAQEAIYAVLDQEKIAYNAGYTALPPSAQPAAFRAFLKQYLTTQRQVDLTQCPESFQEAFTAYLQACEKLETALKPLPGQYEKNTFLKGIQALYQSNPREAEFLGGDVAQAMREVNSRFEQVYMTARENGIES